MWLSAISARPVHAGVSIMKLRKLLSPQTVLLG